MIGTPCHYVQQYYQVPACIGRRVIAYGKPGVIAADHGHYIGVVLDGDAKRQVRNHHPEDGIVYGEMADKLPRAPKRSNYDRFNDEEWNCDFVEYLEINHPQFQRRMEDMPSPHGSLLPWHALQQLPETRPALHLQA
ncbi:hypothetical protein [Pseudomonas sp. KU43P]|uniref:hypothetical protein n=1 Tax=Pseudomonas sp. KU43P TaxID=2487887 RepID=UPI0012A78561|nr:hypothetical protein [Pseudomonas sp. KU43P]BBH46937.1 hypothetical protein KU43P_34140 [Pseudomonas sp. KU43P]